MHRWRTSCWRLVPGCYCFLLPSAASSARYPHLQFALTLDREGRIVHHHDQRQAFQGLQQLFQVGWVVERHLNQRLLQPPVGNRRDNLVGMGLQGRLH